MNRGKQKTRYNEYSVGLMENKPGLVARDSEGLTHSNGKCPLMRSESDCRW